MKKFPRDRSGISIILTILIFFSLFAFGIIFLNLSTRSRDEAVWESARMKAKELANAGLNKAIMLLKHQHEKGNSFWRYPKQGNLSVSEKELKVKVYSDNEKQDLYGEYEILEVTGYLYRKNIHTLIGPYENICYLRNGRKLGHYDILKIVTEGRVKKPDINCRLESIVKVIRQDVIY